MTAAQLTSKAMYNGFAELEVKEEISKICSLRYSHRRRNSFSRVSQNSLGYIYGGNNCSLSIERSKRFLTPPVICPRTRKLLRFRNKLSSESGAEASDLRDTTVKGNDYLASSSGEVFELNETVPIIENVESDSTEAPTSSSRSSEVRRELVMLSLPAIAGQAIDPLVQLMETAYIGRLGSVELASAGVSISVFNIISKLFNVPLLSVATSFVAEDIAKNATKVYMSEEAEGTNGRLPIGVAERHQFSSVSTALFLAVGIGIIEALALALGSELLIGLMGISSTSPMRAPAKRFLALRALGAPAFVVSLALQGIFRGFKDTKTPVFCLGIGNFIAIFLFPLLMYYFGLGVSGAAISTVISQYLVAFSMIWYLNQRVILLPPRFGELQFGGYLKSGGFLIGRTLSVLFTMTLATSMAARQGAVAMAAHQICLQVWLAVSLLTDALAASAQALIASYLSKGDYVVVTEITHYVLKIGLLAGVFLAAALGVSFGSLSTLFTKDAEVLAVVSTGVLFVSASQPINALAFIFDGLHYGVSDFPYAARSMMLVGAISSGFLLFAPRHLGLPGVWLGLTLFMGLRMMAGIIRLLSKKSPWWFLHCDTNEAKDNPKNL
ncbi:PREDICTED: protein DETOXIFICATION 45, chloroplastic-like isoform X1 [Nicotiana attenuata]|uniref:protein DETOXIFICATION 45, chloroplastic-like isoform X1 n=1 Tax=Nicotiana attenuata TaxID=49451 RepID=UPI0009057E68|nr:PREDICTED: protein DETOXIFICATION 45, chloroplastic-like isoform X1 [Nicotiana attenuata]XP_019252270.1 PREDICTED: protein DETOXIFICATION 45, chloroplastic-like isoform X1 [Nicotiana attenuata]XP_019252271.1 PREDICTED: protein DETOXIFICATION 45, chloroplastic-like isoform X1 [Nicotiana attenuata]